jgi:hypothetical protein
MGAPVCLRLRRQGDRIRVCPRGPEEADHLAGERHHSDGGRFPCPTRCRVPPVESELRPPRLGEDGRGLPQTPAGQGGPDPRWVAVST